MRIRIRHETTLSYATPAARTIQVLRLTPRGHDGQFVHNWRVEVDRDCRLSVTHDAFGNVVHSFTANGPLESFVITASGEIETEENNGLLRGQAEPLPASLFLRDSFLTEADPAIIALAEGGAAASGEAIPRLHAVMDRIAEAMEFKVGTTDVATTAAEALRRGVGVCQDFAHIFVSAVRHIGFPARYVGGYLFRPGNEAQDAGHGWAEVYVPDAGWIGFDPVNRISPTPAYVRTAVGLDYQGAAPARGSRSGGDGERLEVKVRIDEIAQRPRLATRVNMPPPPARVASTTAGEAPQ